MGRPSKPYAVLSAEKKSHRTKAEMLIRKQGEEELLSGEELIETPEVQNNVVAHKHFLRISEILRNMGKHDAIYEQSINRYCLLLAEEAELKAKCELIWQEIEEFNDCKGEMDPKCFYDMKNKMVNNAISLDKQTMNKRTMLLAIEKENAMTIAAALRSIPKKVEKQSNALLEVLGGD